MIVFFLYIFSYVNLENLNIGFIFFFLFQLHFIHIELKTVLSVPNYILSVSLEYVQCKDKNLSQRHDVTDL